jgi:HAD superfamily hydrolase (TIGR01549 family)
MTATGVLSVPAVPAVPDLAAAHGGDTTVVPVERVAVVAFDVGETLVDETRIWSRWADRLGVTRLTMLGVLGAMAVLDRPHRDAFEIVRPGIDLEAEMGRWRADDPDGLREHFDAADLYPDVRSCFAGLHADGRRVVIAGNQPPEALDMLTAMDLGVDAIVISDVLGVHKPQAAFFHALVQVAGVEAGRIAYVGDRLDNDVLPARAAGMRTVLLRRGPWGHLHAERPDAALADVVADSLAELPARLAELERT